jgi:hypothetical protein
MFKFLRKHNTVLMTALAVCIIGLLLFGVGGGALTSSPYDPILKVNGTKVTQVDYDRLHQQLIRQRGTLTTEQQQQAEVETIQELIRQEVFYQESKKYGIKVPDQDLQMHLSFYPAFQKDGHFDLQPYALPLR